MEIDVVMNGGRVVERVTVNMPSHVTINGGEGGGGTGEVSSVNGKKGVVVLTAADVGADPAGTATATVGAHIAAVDPHGDRSYTDGQVSALADATAAALSSKASTTDPRLSDPRTPTPHQHPWSEVTGKPSTFDPSAHTHAWSEVTGKPSSFDPSAHTHAWSEVTGKPSTFPPEAHTQDWSTITGKPSSFTPASHTHPLAEVSDFPAPGTAGNVLKSNGTSWESGAAPGGGGGGFGSIPNRSGYVFAPPIAAIAAWGAGSTNRAYYVPILVDPVSVNGLEIAVSTIGAGGEVFRLGIYTDLNGIPDSLVIDAGTVGTDSTGNKRATFATINLPDGWYWLCAASQAGNTSRLRGTTAGIDRIPGIMGVALNASLSSGLNEVPGALPATALVSVNPQPARPSIGLVIA